MDISAAIHLLGDLLGQVIKEQEGPAIFELEERIRLAAKERRSNGTPELEIPESAMTDQSAASDQLTAPDQPTPDPAAADARLEGLVRALTPGEARSTAAAFSMYFDLANLAEEHHRVDVLAGQARARYPQPINESIGAAVAALKACGVSPEQMRALLDRLEIELVFTAHPTEARRRTILSKLRRLADALSRLAQPDLFPWEDIEARQALLAEITTFWLTSRARSSRPAVTDEVRTGLYLVEEVMWETLPRIYADLDAALEQHYPGLTADRPWLRLASWVGGDRDGNPNVTPLVTAETLRLHRGLAVEKHRHSLQEMARRISLSSGRILPPAELLTWYRSRHPLPPHVAFLEERYSNEPFRLMLALMANDLAEASQTDMVANLLATKPHRALVQPEDIARPLAMIERRLPKVVARGEPRKLRRQLAIFGLHSARLDIRVHSEQLNAALGETLRALGICPSFETVPAAERAALLARLLSEPSPELAPHPGFTVETAQTWALFQLLARTRQVYSPALLGPFIISMTRSAADLLTVLLLARWTDCAEGLLIVPLFETLADLDAAPAILGELFALEPYCAHLDSCAKRQMVMIGYSDSNKDSGYLTAAWALYRAQETVTAVCMEHGVDLTFFHGRGGTVARGGGPVNRAIRAQPPGTINGRFRQTEQGEVVTLHYANQHLAHRHLEQLVHAVLLASAPTPLTPPPAQLVVPLPAVGGERGTALPSPQPLSSQGREADASLSPTHPLKEEMGTPLPLLGEGRDVGGVEGQPLPSWRAAVDRMAVAAHRAYRVLVYESPGFGEYWKSVTPLDEIKRLHIGSRPAVRGGAEGVEHIRAIPWVFSWMQSRFNLPGWYGLGSGLAAEPDLALLQDMFAGWPFFRALIDNAELSLLKADMDIAARYSALAPDQARASQFFEIIRAEHALTSELVLQITGACDLMDDEPVIQRSVRMRNPYVDPLNYIQVELLRRLRALPDPNSPEAEDLRQVIVVTINGIAAGLQNTG